MGLVTCIEASSRPFSKPLLLVDLESSYFTKADTSLVHHGLLDKRQEVLIELDVVVLAELLQEQFVEVQQQLAVFILSLAPHWHSHDFTAMVLPQVLLQVGEIFDALDNAALATVVTSTCDEARLLPAQTPSCEGPCGGCRGSKGS